MISSKTSVESMTSFSSLFFKRLLKGVIFFIFLLLIMSAFRFTFFQVYSPKSYSLLGSDFLSAMWVGIKIDAKWLSILLIPAWLTFCLSLWKKNLFYVSVLLAILASLIAILFNAVNFGFYGFYSTPISPLIFGFLEDDTKAILVTLIHDWPVLQYFAIILVCSLVPFFVAYFVPIKLKSSITYRTCFALIALFSALIFVFARGSLGKFPLRQENLSVSTDTFVNASVPNGLSAFYVANKSRKALTISKNPIDVVTELGFRNVEEAKSLLHSKIENSNLLTSTKDNVVFVVMESMGRDIFQSHSNTNNTLGTLEDAMKKAFVFENAVSIAHGTFPSLEGLLFDTAVSPISQSIYGRKPFSFSQVKRFKEAGYKTIFLTGGPEGWRNINETFRYYGFDEILGQANISKMFPEAEKGPWGIGDKWVFKFAEKLMEQYENEKLPLFLMILTTTNHPPYKVPDGDEVLPVNFSELPEDVKQENDKAETEEILKTYQYAADNLGKFVLQLDKKNYLKNTLVVATGDHNSRLKYKIDNNWQRIYGVPIIFWFPENWNIKNLNTKKWLSHRDIFPTLEETVLGVPAQNFLGRNILSDHKKFEPFALTYNPIGGGERIWHI